MIVCATRSSWKTEAAKKESVAYQWPWYSFFSNITIIRNYMGD